MRRISPDLLQKLKNAVNIIEVIGEHVVLRKSGSNYSGLCPFHSERSPSFSVSEPKQLYHCYGCKKSGDILTFLQDLHGLDFPEAVEELAERARIALPKDWAGAEGASPEQNQKREEARAKLATLYKLNRFAAAYYHQQLKVLPEIERYLRGRGVNDELLRSFYVGAAHAGWESLAQHLANAKAPLPLAAELGLIRPSTKKSVHPGGTGYFDLFRHRAMFPILDLRGRVAGFGGRTLPGGEKEGDVESPKYLNSPESPIFQKSRLAFGLFQAQKHVRERDEVVLVEGYFDVTALHGAGFRQAVASCGTALTADHLSLFRKFSSRVTLLFDGDRAGQSALDRSMELGLEHGQILHAAFMPQGLDPDELLFDQRSGAPLPEGQARMKEILASARPLLDVRVEQAIAQAADGPEARTQSIKRIAGWLARFSDRVGREVRIQDVSQKLGISPQLLVNAMGEVGGRGRPGAPSGPPHPGPNLPQEASRQASRAQAEAVRPTPPSPGRPGAGRTRGGRPPQLHPSERVLLAVLARGGAPAKALAETSAELPPGATWVDLFEYAGARDWAGRVFLNPPSEGISTEAAWVSDPEIDPQVRSILAESALAPQAPSKDEVRGAIENRTHRTWARFSQRLKAALADAEARKDAGLASKLMQDYLDVQRKMKEFTTFYDEA